MRPWSYECDQGRIALGGGFGYAEAVRSAAGRNVLPTEPSSPTTHDTEFVARRESVRRRLLRANTAVAVLIASTAVLAMLALWQSLRATKLQASAVANQQRAETAEELARSELWRALLTEARATRRGPSMTRRTEALEALGRAASISPAPELRNEAIAALALPEDRVEATVPLDAAVRTYDFDSALRQAALGLTNGDVVLYQFPAATVSRRLRLADGPIPAEQGSVVGLNFSRDGAALAVRYNRGALAVWDLESGRMRFVRDADQPRRPASRGYFNSDDSVLVAPVFTPDGFAALDARTGATLRHFGQFSSFHHCAVRPGTTQFAVYVDGLVSLMDWATGATIAEYAYPEGARTLEWSADGRLLAIAGASLHVQVRDIARGTRTLLSGPKDSVVNLYFDPTGQHLAAVTADRTSLVWKLPETRPTSVVEGRRFVRWGPAGAAAWAVSRERLELRRPIANPAYTKLAGVPEQAEGFTMDVSADGQWAITRAFPNGLLVWNLDQPAPPEFIALTNVQSLGFHPVEPKLILLRGQQPEERDVSVVAADGRRSLALGAARTQTNMLDRKTDLVTTSADGQTRAYVWLRAGRVWVEHLGGGPRLVEIQDISHSSVEQRSGSPWGTGTLALNTNGSWLVVGADGGRGTSLFDTRTGRRVRTLDGESGGVQFSPDGRWLLLVGLRQARLFRTSDWAVMWSRTADSQSPNSSGVAAFSPDGTMLALSTASSRAALLAAESGRELGLLEAPDAAPLRIARWTKDSRRLVLATRENTLDVWSPAALGTELSKLDLDWNAPTAISPVLGATVPPVTSSKWIAFILLGATGAAAFVALAFLRHHRQLVGEYSQAETLALQRDKELQVERELHDLKSQFVATVSHEFRTPLGVIMSSAENLHDYHDRLKPAQRTDNLRDIIDATRTMSGLMEEVLLLGRVESGKVTFRPAPLDLRAFCERAIEDVQSATNARCPIELHLAPADRPARGDEGLLRHILVNLLTNAVKYSPAGRAAELRITPNEAFAVITIRDHGIGIPAEDLPHLFDAFHRGRNVGDIPGSGLGMVIVKRCVEMHGGTIACNSRVNEGTTLTVRLPLFPRL